MNLEKLYCLIKVICIYILKIEAILEQILEGRNNLQQQNQS